MDADEGVCAVCGDTNAKMHYGKMACYGCKGFFRRTIKDKHRYICRYERQCVVDKQQRNACRYCRFKRCIAVGMDPNAVQPDRDVTGKQRSPRSKKLEVTSRTTSDDSSDWTMRLPLDVRSLMMHLMNIEAQVVRGQVSPYSQECPPVRNRKGTLRDLFEKPGVDMFPGERYEMRHEPNRMASMEELKATGRRSVFAAADWIVSLSEIIDLKLTDDKIALLKASFAPLFMFNLAARTAQNNTKEEILCLSCCSYVPRILPAHFTETNHLANNLIGRIIDELVGPIRKMNLNEQEIVAFKAIVLLNPEAKGLSPGASRTVSQLRDRAQEALFQVIRGLHPTSTASSRFGNLLFLLPTLSTLTSVMSDNVQLANAFNVTRTGPMLAEIFGDFPCDADFLQDLDLSGDEGGRHGSSLSLHVDDQHSDHYITNYTDDYVAHYSSPVSEVGHEVGRHAIATQASNMTDDWTQTDEEDNGGGGGYMNGGSQSPIGSYVENEFDPFSAVSPAPLQIGCGQLFALINDIDPANGFHLL